MIIQLEDPIEVETPLGKGFAVLVESDALEQWWTVILETRAIVTFKQNKLRAIRSYTHGRGVSNEQMREITSEQAPKKALELWQIQKGQYGTDNYPDIEPRSS